MSKNAKAIKLPNRGIVKLEGGDVNSFLQAIITNDIEKLSIDAPVYAAILTPQGKFLFDFFISLNTDGSLFLDCELDRIDDLIRRLTMYKLRADVTISNESDTLDTWAVFDSQLGIKDPRHVDMGNRLYLTKGDKPEIDISNYDEYERLRLSLAIPDGSKDMEIEKRPVLEANFEAINGVSFTKGCYVGQEVTARMQHRGAVRKRMYTVTIADGAPEFGSIVYADDKKAGHMLSSNNNIGLALIKDEFVENSAQLTVDAKAIEVSKNSG